VWPGPPVTKYGSPVPKKPPTSRVPQAVGAIPVVGGLMRSADAQAKWMQEMLEQNARLIGQFPATMKTFNDSIERFNQTIGRLDRAVTRIETATRTMTGPLEKMAGVAGNLDPKALRELPDTLESLRSSLANEALPALRAAADTQRQVALLQTTVDRVITMLGELPGAGIFRRLSATRADQSATRAEAAANARPRPSNPSD
jgi:hypothetical protein